MVSFIPLILTVAVPSIFSQPTNRGQQNAVCKGYHMARDRISQVIDLLQEATDPVSNLKGMMINSQSLGYSYLFMLDNKTWDDARQDCVNKGYQLAWIINMQEHNFIVNITEANPDLSKLDKGLWLGATDLGHENCWVWIGPKIWRVGGNQFTRWASGEPNNYLGDENCMSLNAPHYKWNDVPCSVEIPYLCKRALGTVVTSGVTKQTIRDTPVCRRK